MLYKIVEGFSAEGLCDFIRELLDDGWTLHGSLLVYTEERPIELGSRRTVYTQALIKEETPAELKDRLEYWNRILAMPIDQLTPEERKDREDYLEMEAEAEDAEPTS